MFACLANRGRAQRNRGQGTQAQLPYRRPSDPKPTLIRFKHYCSNQWSSWKITKQQHDPIPTFLSINILIFFFGKQRWLVLIFQYTFFLKHHDWNERLGMNRFCSIFLGLAKQASLFFGWWWLTVAWIPVEPEKCTQVHNCIGHTENYFYTRYTGPFFCTVISSMKKDVWIGWYVKQSFKNPIIIGFKIFTMYITSIKNLQKWRNTNLFQLLGSYSS